MQSLRNVYAILLKDFTHYANMFTQALRKFPMLTQLYYADIMQILHK